MTLVFRVSLYFIHIMQFKVPLGGWVVPSECFVSIQLHFFVVLWWGLCLLLGCDKKQLLFSKYCCFEFLFVVVVVVVWLWQHHNWFKLLAFFIHNIPHLDPWKSYWNQNPFLTEKTKFHISFFEWGERRWIRTHK